MTGCCPLCGGTLKGDVVWMMRDRGMIGRGDRIVPLTGAEFEVFARLYDMRPRVVSKEQMMDWLYQLNPDSPPEIKIIDVYVCKIRKKLEPIGVQIVTHWGKGYSFLVESMSEIKEVEA